MQFPQPQNGFQFSCVLVWMYTPDIVRSLATHIRVKDRIACMATCLLWREALTQDPAWGPCENGFSHYHTWLARIKILHPFFYWDVLQDVPLLQLEKLQELWVGNLREVQKYKVDLSHSDSAKPPQIYCQKMGLATAHQMKELEPKAYDFFSDAGLTCIREKLISVQDAICMPILPFKFSITKLRPLLREGFVTPSQILSIPNAAYLEPTFNPTTLGLIREGLLTFDKLVTMPTSRHITVLTSPEGIKCLREKLITLDQACSLPTVQHLEFLFSEEGLKLLRNKIIDPNELAKIRSPNFLPVIFSPRGLEVVASGLITRQQLAALSSLPALNFALSEKCEQLLRDKVVTIADIKAITQVSCYDLIFSEVGLACIADGTVPLKVLSSVSSPAHINFLLSDKGRKLLSEKVFTPEEIASVNDDTVFRLLTSDDGIDFIRHKRFTISQIMTLPVKHIEYAIGVGKPDILRCRFTLDQIRDVPTVAYFGSIFSECGQIALTENLLTLKEMCTMESAPHLQTILCPNGLACLREKFATPQQLRSMGFHQASEILSPAGLSCLREGVLKFRDLLRFFTGTLTLVLSEVGQALIREGHLKPEDINGYSADFLRQVFTPEGLECLRHKMFTPSGRDSYSGVYDPNFIAKCYEELRKRQM